MTDVKLKLDLSLGEIIASSPATGAGAGAGAGGGGKFGARGTCFNCGQAGHLAVGCLAPRKAGSGACRNCGKEGHFARDCRMAGGGASSRGIVHCYNCQRVGHIAADCQAPRVEKGQCFNCGSAEHLAKDCTQAKPTAESSKCFLCQETGHFARDCKQKPQQDQKRNTCFNCGQEGHFSRECPSGGAGSGGDASNLECFTCGQTGHKAQFCRTRMGAGGRGGPMSRGRRDRSRSPGRGAGDDDDDGLRGRRNRDAGDGEGGGGGNRVFVGNLNFKTSWQQLKDHMRSSGNVVYAKVLLGEDGRSKGCAIVEFETAEEAGDAILNLQNSSLDGREIWVREDREDRGPRQ